MERQIKKRIFLLAGLTIALFLCAFLVGYGYWKYKIEPIREEILQEKVEELQEEAEKLIEEIEEKSGKTFDKSEFESVVEGQDKG